MKRWWIDKDYLGWEEEVLLSAELSLEGAVQLICQAIEHS